MFNKIIDFVYPQVICGICEEELVPEKDSQPRFSKGGYLCEACEFERIGCADRQREGGEGRSGEKRLCSHCGGALPENEYSYAPYGYRCRDCQEKFSFYRFHRSYTFYDDSAKKAIYALKYHGCSYFACLFAERMEQVYRSEPFGGEDWITSVPIHWSRRLFRGYNQAELMATELSERVGIPYAELLKRKKRTKKLHGLGKEDRTEMLKNAIILKDREKQVKDKTILLIDDIHTTGTTLEAAASALYFAGAKEIRCMTFAMARR